MAHSLYVSPPPISIETVWIDKKIKKVNCLTRGESRKKFSNKSIGFILPSRISVSCAKATRTPPWPVTSDQLLEREPVFRFLEKSPRVQLCKTCSVPLTREPRYNMSANSASAPRTSWQDQLKGMPHFAAIPSRGYHFQMLMVADKPTARTINSTHPYLTSTPNDEVWSLSFRFLSLIPLSAVVFC